MAPQISIIIPNHNGSRTIERCLHAVFASHHDSFEVIVVDDCSTDDSVAKIRPFPCRLITLTEHGGASTARNTGAAHSTGELLFFLDADCLLLPDTLARATAAATQTPEQRIIGGTYTAQPPDHDFFSTFQSVFINYSETKNLENPDYIATHAMIIPAAIFQQSGGFDEHFMPIIEDVEFSHRLKRQGHRLVMNPEIQVRHIFDFSLVKSLRNGFKKSRYWTIYSIRNQDLLADSGTASREFKVNVATLFCCLALLMTTPVLAAAAWSAIALLLGFNLFLNKQLIRAFYHTSGPGFALGATLYYTLLYPLTVGAGGFSGLLAHHLGRE